GERGRAAARGRGGQPRREARRPLRRQRAADVARGRERLRRPRGRGSGDRGPGQAREREDPRAPRRHRALGARRDAAGGVGWYRYVSEWRLRANGEIRPRFGFGATTSSCVCNIHHHHTYWRFDFAVAKTSNSVEEFNDPPAGGGAKWKRLQWETRRMRSPAHKRRWRVGDGSGHAYEIVPGPHDG